MLISPQLFIVAALILSGSYAAPPPAEIPCLMLITRLRVRWDEPTPRLFTLGSWPAEAGDHPRKRPLKWKRSFSRADGILITQQQQQQHGSVSSRKLSYL